MKSLAYPMLLESSTFEIFFIINPVQQLCITRPIQATFILMDRFCFNDPCLASVRQTLQTRPSSGTKLRNVDPEVRPQVPAYEVETSIRYVNAKFIFIEMLSIVKKYGGPFCFIPES